VFFSRLHTRPASHFWTFRRIIPREFALLVPPPFSFRSQTFSTLSFCFAACLLTLQIFAKKHQVHLNLCFPWAAAFRFFLNQFWSQPTVLFFLFFYSKTPVAALASFDSKKSLFSPKTNGRPIPLCSFSFFNVGFCLLFFFSFSCARDYPFFPALRHPVNQLLCALFFPLDA